MFIKTLGSLEPSIDSWGTPLMSGYLFDFEPLNISFDHSSSDSFLSIFLSICPVHNFPAYHHQCSGRRCQMPCKNQGTILHSAPLIYQASYFIIEGYHPLYGFFFWSPYSPSFAWKYLSWGLDTWFSQRRKQTWPFVVSQIFLFVLLYMNIILALSYLPGTPWPAWSFKDDEKWFCNEVSQIS